MTRHSKNATAGPTYTANEKNKDSKQSGYGSKDVRLGKDSIKVKNPPLSKHNFKFIIY
jgi:nitric oxide synthase-interacting protein